MKQYYQYICDSMIGTSAREFGEFCQRDLEFMAIGTPFFRKTFKAQTDRIVKHFLNLFESNGELRKFTKEEYEQYCEISENGKKWYDENGHPESNLKLLVRILEENDIL